MALLTTAIASPRMLYQGIPASPILDEAYSATPTVTDTGATLPTGTYYFAHAYVNHAGIEGPLSPVGNQAVTLGQTLTIDVGFTPQGCFLVNYYVGNNEAYLHKQATSGSTTLDISAPLIVTGPAVPNVCIQSGSLTTTSATIPVGAYEVHCSLSYGGVEGLLAPLDGWYPLIDVIGKQVNLTVTAVPAGYTLNVYMGVRPHTPTLQGTIAAGGTTYTITSYSTTGRYPLHTNPTLVGQLLYTAPASNVNVTPPSATAYITELDIVNSSISDATMNLFIVPSGNNGQPENQFISTNAPIKAGDTFSIAGLKLAMPPGSSIYASTSYGALLAVHISGVEVQ